jgi:limonene-1,2-epoxide hydrolase
MASDNVEQVRRFCDAFARRDSAELLGFFTEDAVYHNMPMAPVKGKDAIKGVLDMFLGPAKSVEFAVLQIAETGPVVFTERIDRFDMGGRKVELPIAGVFEMQDGKIAAWRDYFDLATWTKQASGGA